MLVCLVQLWRIAAFVEVVMVMMVVMVVGAHPLLHMAPGGRK